MKILLVLSVLIASMGFISGNNDHVTEVSGVVVNDKTGKPIKGALVYVVAGEEEALTKDNGVFKITTSKKTPVTITAEHQQYHTGRISITDTRQQIIVRLKAK